MDKVSNSILRFSIGIKHGAFKDCLSRKNHLKKRLERRKKGRKNIALKHRTSILALMVYATHARQEPCAVFKMATDVSARHNITNKQNFSPMQKYYTT
jgi:hypothetical protein